MKFEEIKKKAKEKNINKLNIVLIIIIIILLFLAFRGCSGQNVLSLAMDGDQKDIHEENPNGSEASAEYTSFPAFSKIKVGKDDVYVQLKNPESNTVNFVYTITQTSSVGEVVWEGNEDEVSTMLSPMEKTYTNVKKNNEYFFGDDEGNTYKTIDAYKVEKKDGKARIVKLKKTMIYFTDGIAPSKSVDWKIKAFITKDCDIDINIATYDVKTNKPCVGTNISAKVVFV